MKFCEECGAKLEDEAMFCDECGAKIEFIESAPAYEEPAPAPVVENITQPAPTPVVEEKIQQIPIPNVEYSTSSTQNQFVQTQPAPVVQKDNNQKTGAKSGKLGIIIGAAAAAVVVIAVVLIIVLSGGSDEPMTTADSEQTSVEQPSAFEDYVNKSEETMAAEEAKRLEEEQKAAEEAKRLEEEQQAAEEMKRLEEEKKAAEEELARLQEENKALQEEIQQSVEEDELANNVQSSSNTVPYEYNKMLQDGASGTVVPVHFRAKEGDFIGSYDNGDELILLMDGDENLPVYVSVPDLNARYIYMDKWGYLDIRGILYTTTYEYYDDVYFLEMPYVRVYGEYMFPNSGSEYLSEMLLESYSKDELRIGRNEIFARHGRIFVSEDLDEYFRSQDWYDPRYTSDEFDSMVTLNAYEKANIDLMKQIEDNMQ